MESVLQELAANAAEIREIADSYPTKISGHYAVLIWQYTRFNKLYQRDYENLENMVSHSVPEELIEDDAFLLGEKWALDLSLEDYHSVRLPENAKFAYPIIEKIRWQALLTQKSSLEDDYYKEYLRLKFAERTGEEVKKEIGDFPSLYAIFNPGNLSSIQKGLQITGPIRKYAIKASVFGTLIENVALYHWRKTEGLDPKEIEAKFKGLFLISGKTFQSQQIDNRCRTFEAHAARSPWMFLFQRLGH